MRSSKSFWYNNWFLFYIAAGTNDFEDSLRVHSVTLEVIIDYKLYMFTIYATFVSSQCQETLWKVLFCLEVNYLMSFYSLLIDFVNESMTIYLHRRVKIRTFFNWKGCNYKIGFFERDLFKQKMLLINKILCFPINEEIY